MSERNYNRAHERFPFKKNSYLKLTRANSRIIELYRVVDLSQGGLSFYMGSGLPFQSNDQVLILDIDGKAFAEPLVAVIRHVGKLDDSGIHFKIGVEFIKRGL